MTTTASRIAWPASLDPWLPFSPISHAKMSQLNGASLYLINGRDQYDLALEITQTLGGSLSSSIQDATHALWIQSDGEDYTQNIECSLAESLSIPIVDANRWLARISNLRHSQHWSEVNVEDYRPRLLRRPDLFLAESLTQTLQVLSKEDPGFVEENALKRAMELSMLDCALVIRDAKLPAYSRKNQSPHGILGLPPDASITDIKKAYRKLARLHHPDKGGSPDVFEQISFAYQSLLTAQTSSSSSHEKGGSLKSTAHWDSELKDHHRLVQDLFTSHGANLTKNVAAQADVLEALGLEAQDAGSTNVNERHETIHNSCFYLSLAASYLKGIGAMDNLKEDNYLVQQAALQFKRLIEASVVTAHPEWAVSGQVGEHVQAFSDFLVYLLDSPDTIISDWAVVVFDTTSGVCDIYKGKFYDKLSDKGKAANCVTIQYLPGHYQPLIMFGNKLRPNLDQILQALHSYNVLYVVTDGNA